MQLKWREEALADLQRIFAFNAERSESFAMHVERRLLERAEALRRMPRLGRPLNHRDLMRLSVPDIQYAIDYQPFDDRISIARIRSTREIR